MSLIDLICSLFGIDAESPNDEYLPVTPPGG